MALFPTGKRLTVDEYYEMARGVYDEDDRVELIEGEVIEMTPIGLRHASCVSRLMRRFILSIGDDAFAWPQNPVRLNNFSEPQPDVALLRPRPDFYATHPVLPEDIFLLVEVADSSLEFDRKTKAPLYARMGILELWIVDVEQETVTVYLDPSAEGYRTVRVLRHGDNIAVAAFPDRSFAVADFVG